MGLFDRFRSKSTLSSEDTIVDRNLKGKELEKKGDIQGAIELYEQNVTEEVDTPHPYTRLAVIYRRQKRLPDEIRVLEKAIKVQGSAYYQNYYGKQLSKAREKERVEEKTKKGGS